MCECLLACSRKGFWWVTRACALFRFWQGMPTDHLMKGVKAEKVCCKLMKFPHLQSNLLV